MSLFRKVRQEQFAHGRKGQRAKSESAKSKFLTLSKTNERYPFKGLYLKNTRGEILKKMSIFIFKKGCLKVFTSSHSLF